MLDLCYINKPDLIVLADIASFGTSAVSHDLKRQQLLSQFAHGAVIFNVDRCLDDKMSHSNGYKP